MWNKTHSKIYKNVSKEAVWKIWKDINNYANWHDDLDYCQLKGEFAKGNYFLLKPKGGPKVKVWLLDIKENESFLDCTRFFGAKMYDLHSLEDTSEGLKISNTITVKGPLAFLWTKLVAKDVAAHAPQEMDAVVDLARGSHG
ncbi:MAG: polyketide cyclase [Legionellaceae bacterium]|nr:polyketide cyclase [Legionellaceae bacterium]|tara:strand:+ start:244 stop:669 length:426 start_codon:yes stop_codon:yes gene_type:complete